MQPGEKDFEDFDRNRFDQPTNIDNAWMPLKPGTRFVYEGTSVDDEGEEEVQIRRRAVVQIARRALVRTEQIVEAGLLVHVPQLCHLERLVAEHRLREDEAHELAADLACHLARAAYRLG